MAHNRSHVWGVPKLRTICVHYKLFVLRKKCPNKVYLGHISNFLNSRQSPVWYSRPITVSGHHAPSFLGMAQEFTRLSRLHTLNSEAKVKPGSQTGLDEFSLRWLVFLKVYLDPSVSQTPGECIKQQFPGHVLGITSPGGRTSESAF